MGRKVVSGRTFRPIGGELSTDDAVERRGEGGDDPFDILVGEDGEKGDDRAAVGNLGQGLGQGAGAVRVVGCVDEDRRLVREQLEPAGHDQRGADLGGQAGSSGRPR